MTQYRISFELNIGDVHYNVSEDEVMAAMANLSALPHVQNLSVKILDNTDDN